MAKQATLRDNRADMMLTEPIPKVILKMAFPTIVAFLINSIYSLADTFFVSSLGTNATAAVSVNSSLDQIIMMAGSMLAVGANSFIARLLGAKNKEMASKTLSTSFFIAMGFGAIIMVLGVTFMKPMVRLLGATETCEQYAIDYATYVLLVAPFMAANFVMNQCLRAEGSATLSMLGMASGGVLNCVLDPIFIFGLNMGVAGASLATAISKLVSFVILIFPYVTKRSVLRLSIKNVYFNGKLIGEIINVGSSSLFRSALAVVAAVVLNNIAGGISDSVLAGVGVTNKIMMFPFSIILGFGTGFQPVTGFNWGAQRYDRVMESYKFATRVALWGSVLMGVILWFGAEPIIALFGKDDPYTNEIGTLCMRLQCLAMPAHGWVASINMFCAGLGQAKEARLLSTARQGTCFLPIAPVLAWIGGANGVAAVQAVADVLTIFLAIPVTKKVLGMVKKAQEEHNITV